MTPWITELFIMHKTGWASARRGSHGINTERTLPEASPGGRNTAATVRTEVSAEESHGLPGLEADAPNLAYESEKPEGLWDESEFDFLLIDSIALQEMEVPVYDHAYVVDPQAPGTPRVGDASIHSPSRTNEDEEVGLSEFVAGLTKEDLSPVASPPQGDDEIVRPRNTRQSKLRENYGKPEPRAKVQNLKALPNSFNARHDSQKPSFKPTSPRGQTLTTRSEQLGLERKRPVSQPVDIRDVRGLDADWKLPDHQAVPSPNTRAKRETTPLDVQGKRSAYKASLQSLEEELDDLFDVLSSTSAQPPSEKSDNS